MNITASDVLSIVESLSIDEGPKKVISFSGGRKHIKLDCPPGYKLDGNKCVKMSSTELKARSKGARKAALKRKSHQSAINRSRAKTMAKRNAAI